MVTLEHLSVQWYIVVLYKLILFNMKINNKYEIDQKVYYPGADMGNPSIIESTITGVSLWVGEDKAESISYRTIHSYGVNEKHLAKTKNKAKKILLDMMKDKQTEINSQINNAIKIIEDTKAKDLIQKLPNEQTNPLSQL